MKVAVIGSRTASKSALPLLLKYIPEDTSEIVSGGAAGVDTMAEEVAKALSLPVRVFEPDYATYGKNAPLKRNEQIVDYADYVLAFWDVESHGTGFTVAECIKRGKPFRIVPLADETT